MEVLRIYVECLVSICKMILAFVVVSAIIIAAILLVCAVFNYLGTIAGACATLLALAGVATVFRLLEG